MKNIYVLLALLIPSVCWGTDERQTVYWLYSAMPPAHISEGPHKDAGYADMTLKLIFEKLPDYNHVKVQANYKRSLAEMQSHGDMCHSALLKTPDREALITFSIPTYIVSSNRLFVKKSKQELIHPYLHTNGKIDLVKLLRSEKFLLGVSSGAKYGNAIDKMLALSTSKDNLVYRSAIDHYSGLSEMLEKKSRIEGFLGLGVENRYFQKPDSNLTQTLMALPIKGVDDFLVGYIGCSNSLLGNRLIDKINDIVQQERTNKIKDYYQSWLMDKDRIAHQKMIDKTF